MDLLGGSLLLGERPFFVRLGSMTVRSRGAAVAIETVEAGR